MGRDKSANRIKRTLIASKFPGLPRLWSHDLSENHSVLTALWSSQPQGFSSRLEPVPRLWTLPGMIKVFRLLCKILRKCGPGLEPKFVQSSDTPCILVPFPRTYPAKTFFFSHWLSWNELWHTASFARNALNRWPWHLGLFLWNPSQPRLRVD